MTLLLGFTVGFLLCWSMRGLKGIAREALAFKGGFELGYKKGYCVGHEAVCVHVEKEPASELHS